MIDITLTLQNSMPVKGEPFRSRFRIFQIDGSIGQPPGFLIVIIRIARVQISADRHFGLRFAVGKLVRQLRHAVSTLRYARQILARVTVGYVGCNRRRRIFQLDALQFPIIIGVLYCSTVCISCQINVAVIIIIYSQLSAAIMIYPRYQTEIQ